MFSPSENVPFIVFLFCPFCTFLFIGVSFSSPVLQPLVSLFLCLSILLEFSFLFFLLPLFYYVLSPLYFLSFILILYFSLPPFLFFLFLLFSPFLPYLTLIFFFIQFFYYFQYMKYSATMGER